jgi:hypothetical protein
VKPDVKLAKTADQLVARDSTWLDLGALRELVRQADANGWADGSLVSHSGGGEHPSLRGMRTATYLVVEGPA